MLLFELHKLTRFAQETVETLCPGHRVVARVLSPRTVVKLRGLPIRYLDGCLKPQSELRGMIQQHLILWDHAIEGQVMVRENNGQDVTSYTFLDNKYEIARTLIHMELISIARQVYESSIVTDSIFNPSLSPTELATQYILHNRSLRLTKPEQYA